MSFTISDTLNTNSWRRSRLPHLYHLRKRQRYRECRPQYVKTRPVQVCIGERRKPEPGGQPDFLRVDKVHQGDSETGEKGVYHINAVNEVTLWQVSCHIVTASSPPTVRRIGAKRVAGVGCGNDGRVNGRGKPATRKCQGRARGPVFAPRPTALEKRSRVFHIPRISMSWRVAHARTTAEVCSAAGRR